MSASAFYVGADKQNQDDKIDLKLSGDKVKLEVRPLSNLGKASSRCALLGPNSSGRPVSALPLLDLYQFQYDDFEVSTNNRRPFSADCINFSKIDRNQFLRQESSDSSSDFDEKNLPSSNLLQNLLKEPIKSWRTGEKFDFKNDDFIISEELPKNLQSNTEDKETMVKNVLSKSDLKPGLIGKPPLPKKPDLNQINQSTIGSNQFKLDHLKNNPKKDDQNKKNQHQKIVGFDFENSSMENANENGEKEDDLDAKRNSQNFGERQQLRKCVSYEIPETTFWASENVDQSTNHCQKFVEKNIGDFEHNQNQPINKDLMVQNWILGEKSVKYEIVENTKNAKDQNFVIKDTLENEVIFKEHKTDESMKNLSQKYTECSEMNCDERFKKFFDVPSVPKSEFEHPTKPKLKNDVGRKKSPKIKMEVTKPKLIKIGTNTGKPNTKNGFSPKPIKSKMDFHPQTNFDEATSWMAQNYLNEQSEPNHNSKTARSSLNYLDVLENLEELQDLSRKIETDNLLVENEPPEQDSDKGYETSTDNGTYDEIVSILEVLEAEDKRSQKKMESIKEIVTTELCEKTQVEDITPARFDQNGDFGRNLQKGNFHSSNFGHLLQFLDEVDRNCNKTIEQAQERVQKVTEVLETTFNLDTIPKMADLMSLTNLELAQQVIDLSLRVKDKSSSVALLQREMSGLREQIMKINKQSEHTIKEKLKTQKQEYESTIKRHQQFIDQLIADKKSLNQQCEGLVHEMKVLEDRFASNMKAMEHRHQVELQKAKEMCVAGEKIRRERWIDNKTQKIKDMTVKSITPELEKMERRQQQELADLRALHKNEIEDLELKAARKTQQQLENLRHHMIEEREKTLAHEREVMRIRYEKLVESEEKAYQEQRRRLLSEISKRQKEYEEKAAMLEEEKTKAIEHARQEFEEKLETLVRRHNNELKLMKETSEIEMEAHRNNFKKQLSMELAQKEATIKEYYRKERDREIETIIERLEAESNENKLQIENSAENRIKRIKEKYENELKELELSEKETKKKCAQVKTKLAETEETVITLKASLRKLQTQLEESTKVSKTLTDERSKIKEVLKREMSDETEILKRDVAKIKSEHERELQQVYARVKVSVARKDEIISELTGELKASKEKCVYLENMLEQQRKEYLMK